jgi:hypothetical protein
MPREASDELPGGRVPHLNLPAQHPDREERPVVTTREAHWFPIVNTPKCQSLEERPLQSKAFHEAARFRVPQEHAATLAHAVQPTAAGIVCEAIYIGVRDVKCAKHRPGVKVENADRIVVIDSRHALAVGADRQATEHRTLRLVGKSPHLDQ